MWTICFTCNKMNLLSSLAMLAGILVALGQFLLKKNIDGIAIKIVGIKSFCQFLFNSAVNPSVLFSLLIMFSGSVVYLISLRFVALTLNMSPK